MSSFQIWCLAATGLKKVGTEQQRPEKAGHFENIQLGEHLATNLVNWHQVCNMISYKREVLERQSLSEVKMGRGSPICGRVRKKIVEYFKNNVRHVKLQRLCKSHHLQFITPSKYSEKLEKSLCARDKRTKTANIFFCTSPTNLLNFAKPKHRPSNKIWAWITWTEHVLFHKRVRMVALFRKPV